VVFKLPALVTPYANSNPNFPNHRASTKGSGREGGREGGRERSSNYLHW